MHPLKCSAEAKNCEDDLMDSRTSRIVLYAAIGFITFYIIVQFLAGKPDTDKQRAERLRCAYQIADIGRRLLHGPPGEKVTFPEGIESYIKANFDEQDLICPSKAELGKSSYEYNSFADLEELITAAEKDGTWIMRDKKGNHKGGRNVLVAEMKRDSLFIYHEWRPLEAENGESAQTET